MEDMRKRKWTDSKIRIVTPVYGKDWLYWRVYVNWSLVGQYKSMWQAEQCAKEYNLEYPNYEMEVI